MLRRVTIEKLAPTGEGVARGPDGVGFVSGALPGEEVEVEVDQVRRRFWRGHTARVLRSSPDRTETSHAGCGGCDWAHFAPEAACAAKRELFRESLERIGKIPRGDLGELPVLPSPPGYRLRNRFHVERGPKGVRIGFFAPRTHRVQPVESCLAIGEETRRILPRLAAALGESDVAVEEVATLEDMAGRRRLAQVRVSESPREEGLDGLLAGLEPLFEGLRIVTPTGRAVRSSGAKTIELQVGTRTFSVGIDSFFQSNRHLVRALSEDAREFAAAVPSGRALDAFGGVGLFAGALLDAGHSTLTVEQSPASVQAAIRTRRIWGSRADWQIVQSSTRAFLEGSEEEFGVVVADPPRAGLGARVAQALARRTRSRLILFSCEPPTLARDLPEILSAGFRIEAARLYDVFAYTHRVEALVVLVRSGGG